MNIEAAPAPTVAQALVRYVADLGVRHAFGVSGGGIAAVWAALSASAIRVGHFRHESGAVFAAIEAHFATGEPVVVFTTTGPGLTNALTGLLAARDEGAKVILVSGCTAAAQRGKWAIQETGAEAVPAGLFHMAATLDSADGLPPVLRRVANGLGRPGGFLCHLALPTNLQSERAPVMQRFDAVRGGSDRPCDQLVERCAGLLEPAGAAIWLGFGARHAAGPIRALAERLGAPVMCSPRAKGIFPEDHPLFIGVTGMGGHGSVLSYMETHRPRRTLVLGTRLGEPTSFWDPVMVPEHGFIHVDIDPDVAGVAFPHTPVVPVRADVGAFATALLDRLPGPNRAPPPDLPKPHVHALPSRETGRVRPQALMAAIQRVVIDRYDGLVLAECGNGFTWATHYLRFRAPGRYRVSTGVGAMGHCAAGVVGAAVATGRKTVAIVGDGAMLMTNEINTAVALDAPAVWIVLNDGRYNMCEQGMAALGLIADASIPLVNFALLARALGADGTTAASEQALDAVIAAAIISPVPFVVDVRIDHACIAPSFGHNRGLRRQIPAWAETGLETRDGS